MSAGTFATTDAAARPTADLSLLAPRFRAAVEAALAECNAPPHELHAVVHETWRSDALQALYYARGRTVRPPDTPVTNAPDARWSWHGYGLAVDVVHATLGWDPPAGWFRAVAAVFARHGCRWGGEWVHPDPPHFQWGACRPGPSDEARALLRAGGVEAVWAAVGAGSAPTPGDPPHLSPPPPRA